MRNCCNQQLKIAPDGRVNGLPIPRNQIPSLRNIHGSLKSNTSPTDFLGIYVAAALSIGMKRAFLGSNPSRSVVIFPLFSIYVPDHLADAVEKLEFN